MDRLNHLRGEAGGSGDSTLDTTSPPSEAFMSANENSLKYFSINDSTFDIASIKDESLASTSAEADRTITDGDDLISNLSPIGKKELDSYKIGKQIEAAKILSGGVDIFEGDENSFDGNELVIDDHMEAEDKVNDQPEVLPIENVVEPEPAVVEPEENVASREMEVVLQIDGNNVNAIDIGNGLYLYRKDGQDELAAIQIIDDDPQHSFKFLKVRDNAEGNLEVYEEIEIEVPKEVPTKEGKLLDKNTPHVPTEDITKSSEPKTTNSNFQETKNLSQKEPVESTSTSAKNTDVKETLHESKAEVNVNGKMMKFSESRKSPVVGSFTPMTFHSTPIKEGKPLTKTMVDFQLDPNRHSDNVKKTIEVHTENIKQKPNQPEIAVKEKVIKMPEKENNICETVKSADTPTETGTEQATQNKINVNYKQETEKHVLKEENKHNQSEAASAFSNTRETHGCEKKTETSDTIGKELVIKDQNNESKISDCIKKLNDNENTFVKTDASLVKASFTKDNATISSKLNKSDVPLPPASNKEDGSSILSIISDQKLEAPLPAIVEKVKLVDINKPVLNVNEAVKHQSDNENDSNGSTVKSFLPVIGKAQQITSEKIEVEKDKPSKIKILENITLNFPKTSDSIKKLSTNEVESSVKSGNDNIKFNLESFSEVSSTCTNIGRDESKEESITLYSIETDESVSLITPSSTDKTTDDKVVLSDKISEVLTTISNLNNIQTENTSVEHNKPVVSFPILKESIMLTEPINDADSTCKISELVSCSNSEKKNITKTSNVQKSIAVVKSTLPEKAVLSIPVPKEKASTCTVPSNDKTLIEHSITFELKPHVDEIQPSLGTDEKSIEKECLSNTNLISTTPQIAPTTQIHLREKEKKSAVLQDIKTAQATSKPELKPQTSKSIPSSNLTEKKYPATLTKTTAKATNIIPISADAKISSTTSNTNYRTDSHIPVVSVAHKPTLKHISATVFKAEEIVKPVGSAGSKIEVAKINTLDRKLTVNKIETRDIKEPIKKLNVQIKPVNNNHTVAVPFGKWTDAHRQEFLNKFKEVKAPLNTNSKQIKNSNDLNRRDVLQKIDSQRAQTISNAAAKNQEKLNVKSETVFTTKVISPTIEMKTLPNNELSGDKPPNKITILHENFVKSTLSSTLPMSRVTEVKSKTVDKSNFSHTGQNITGKPESTSKVQITAEKAEHVQKCETTIDKIGPIAKDQNTDSKTESFPKDPIISGKKDVQHTPLANSKLISKEQNIADQAVIEKDQIILGKIEPAPKDQIIVGKIESISRDHITVSKTETASSSSTASCYMASLIDKTIEDMINRVTPCKNMDESKQATLINSNEQNVDPPKPKQEISIPPVSLDDIEMKMNELHGIPFVERPPHELPKILKSEIKTYSKIDKKIPLSTVSKVPNTNYISTQPTVVKDLDSDEEIIEHEPVTGDLELKKKNVSLQTMSEEKKNPFDKNKLKISDKRAADKGTEIITEKDFDKFARRNSITYENCLTVNFDPKEPQNIVQRIKQTNVASKIIPKPESTNNEIKSKLSIQYHTQLDKSQDNKLGNVAGDSSNKKHQSKIHSAYQSALTAKHQVSSPISIIEDKPVKVVYLESNIGFVPSQLNVQGKELSPGKKPLPETDAFIPTKNNAVDLGLSEYTEENKQLDKTKIKHQRKQVLTPVEEPDLELIQPSDIGIETTSKKRRRVEEVKAKSLVPKKSYLLGRNSTAEDKTISTPVIKDNTKDIINRREDVSEHKNTASAIDNLVKAAELLDNQAEIESKSITSNPASQTSTPVKRGRGRPRKYPLPDGAIADKSPSPQKKPRLIDAKPIKQDSISDDQDDSSEEGIVRENWTMGKINENIVCPICNKLFRSENVVFKHVKHCTGVSPNRSESDKKSPQRSRLSQESEDIDIDYDMSSGENKKDAPKKLKSKEHSESEEEILKGKSNVDDEYVIVIEDTPMKEKNETVIVVEDTPIKEKSEKLDKEKKENSKKESKPNPPHRNKSLICEFCGKTFRQQSYLTSHKLQHKKDLVKKKDKDTQDSNKLQVFSCEVCQKEFRKLHHLVQHRINHNPAFVKRTLRKSLSEQNDTKNLKDVVVKPLEDASAGFRCEPCDKSFRKLHHLVEHRGTHDGINRHKSSIPVLPNVEKPPLPPQCDICKKTFRKLHHLIEHKEQHIDTSSDKSDDKSIKSALSTKDIIHECSLCYMVFPNEHSLNKHSVMCLKKKQRQSKQLKDTADNESGHNDENPSTEINNEIENVNMPEILESEDMNNIDKEEIKKQPEPVTVNVNNPVTEEKHVDDEKVTQVTTEVIEPPLEGEIKFLELPSTPIKQDLPKSDLNKDKEKSVVPEKKKKNSLKEVKTRKQDMILEKKTVSKNIDTSHVTKRQKSIDTPLSTVDAIKSSMESSDDDEIRYMLNPNFKVDKISEEKPFMKVKATKRNSLQIERPSSNDHSKRRTSLQLPPKISRLKLKANEIKTKPTESTSKLLEPKAQIVQTKPKIIENKNSSKLKHVPKLSETDAVLSSTDSDDSDVKYSFPKTVTETSKPTAERTSKNAEKRNLRKSLTEKRKSLSGIAKRKSSGKAITAKHKDNPPLSPAKQVKKRSLGVEHRCDCGELFSSAALLARHTSLAHTPPRIRRRRDPPAPVAPAAPQGRSEPPPTRKSSVKRAQPTPAADSRNSLKPTHSEAAPKTRRSAAHSGVPVPEKMRKMMQKLNKLSPVNRVSFWQVD